MPIINRERTVDGWAVTTELPDHSATFMYTKLDGDRWLFNGKPVVDVSPHHKWICEVLEEAIND